jgi:CRISPR/Cas system Type II protein with McrA/HNH and RuvC-like nuclease domain
MAWHNKQGIRGQVYQKAGGRCEYCGKEIAWGEPWDLDHRIPKKQGGGRSIANLAMSCGPCNRAKSNRTIEQWRDTMHRTVTRHLSDALASAEQLRFAADRDEQQSCIAEIENLIERFKAMTFRFYCDRDGGCRHG